MEDGSEAAGLFNRSTKPARVTLRWADLKIEGRRRVRALWRQEDVGVFDGEFTAEVRPHGVVMAQLFAEKSPRRPPCRDQARVQAWMRATTRSPSSSSSI